ncbi:hypothetical protein [Gemmatimonas sp.]
MSDQGTQPKIGYRLFAATQQAIEIFRRHLPKGTLRPNVAGDSPTAEMDYVREWAVALVNVTVEAIPDAASQWLRDEEHIDAQGRTRIPNIAAFARYARRVDLADWRAPHLQVIPGPPVLSGRIHDLTTRALRTLGSREHAESVWGELFTRAAPGEECQRVREGRVTDAEFDAAVATVRARLDAERHAAAGGHHV